METTDEPESDQPASPEKVGSDIIDAVRNSGEAGPLIVLRVVDAAEILLFAGRGYPAARRNLIKNLSLGTYGDFTLPQGQSLEDWIDEAIKQAADEISSEQGPTILDQIKGDNLDLIRRNSLLETEVNVLKTDRAVAGAHVGVARSIVSPHLPDEAMEAYDARIAQAKLPSIKPASPVQRLDPGNTMSISPHPDTDEGFAEIVKRNWRRGLGRAAVSGAQRLFALSKSEPPRSAEVQVVVSESSETKQ